MEKLKSLGFKLTPQRLAILKYLKGNKEHPSAETIYKALKRKFPTMSLATIYNTIENLKKKGLIWELTLDPDKKRIDPNPEPHHHFLCEKCHRIFDVLYEISVPLERLEQEGFQITRSQVEFIGLCPHCKKIKK